MAMEIEVGKITACDDINGKAILAEVAFKYYDKVNEDIIVDVVLPLDKEASLSEIEERALQQAKKKLKELVSGF
ncbi:hypothetical protein RF657_16620 [Yersinia rochesterensis]|uniref:hypothetical protein n=1 Tax=Yersinia rochesterensis TaxID=1604335 RepID=UPI002853328F|nr:hypothetical protein [Yersinia rochesterensis]MDR5020003.1 hypothetical protein [Yersinia rochesterensis]